MNFLKPKSEYCVTFWIEADNKNLDELTDILHDADCSDAVVYSCNGQTYVTFDKEVLDLIGAVSEAWDKLGAAGLGVKGIFEGLGGGHE